MIKKLLIIFAIVILGFSLFPGVVYAALSASDPIINQIDAYQSVEKTNDQLYIIAFEIYDTTGDNATVETTYLFRFYVDGVLIATATPYAYPTDGEDQGAIGFYFSATDTDLPTWSTANISIELLGNPALDWGGDPPIITSNTINSWQINKVFVGARIRTLAAALESVWDVDLIEPIQSVLKLTTDGEDYFGTVIPNLRAISPELFTSTVTAPYFPDETKATTYADTVEARWLTSGNGTFDMTDMGTLFSISREWMTAFLYIALCIGLLFGASYGITNLRTGGQGSITGVGLRPAVFLFLVMLVLGSYMSFLPFVVGLFAAIGAAFAVVYSLFWKGSV